MKSGNSVLISGNYGQYGTLNMAAGFGVNISTSGDGRATPRKRNVVDVDFLLFLYPLYPVNKYSLQDALPLKKLASISEQLIKHIFLMDFIFFLINFLINKIK
jgi:hypothetical protein